MRERSERISNCPKGQYIESPAGRYIECERSEHISSREAAKRERSERISNRPQGETSFANAVSEHHSLKGGEKMANEAYKGKLSNHGTQVVKGDPKRGTPSPAAPVKRDGR